MIFSVLIPSVPSRHAQACALFDKISKQAEGYDVEVLMLCDNKKRSVGKKREALVQASLGDYVAFVDDDDDVADCYVSRIVEAIQTPLGFVPDVITFDSWVTLNHLPAVLCRHALGNKNEQYDAAGFERAPWHINAWRSWIAKAVLFPDNTGHEDWPWCEEMLRVYVRKSYKINAALYHYRFDEQTTEASVGCGSWEAK
jgi:hypothetical protein